MSFAKIPGGTVQVGFRTRYWIVERKIGVWRKGLPTCARADQASAPSRR
jgi:hypothetical protein